MNLEQTFHQFFQTYKIILHFRYKAQLDEEQELDPRIRLMLDQLHVLTEGKVTCVVRNFEKKPKWTAKQRWKISGKKDLTKFD